MKEEDKKAMEVDSNSSVETKLIALALWFDVHDKEHGSDGDEVQQNLRKFGKLFTEQEKLIKKLKEILVDEKLTPFGKVLDFKKELKPFKGNPV